MSFDSIYRAGNAAFIFAFHYDGVQPGERRSAMNKLRIKIFSVFFALFTAMFISSCSKGTRAGSFVISFIGSVEITRGAEAPRAVLLGEELKQGDRIVTGPDSFVVFSIGDRAVARVQPDSDVVLTSITDLSKINLMLDRGGVLNKVGKVDKGASYRVTTPTVVASVRGTVFSTYYEEGSNTVAVKAGTVNVAVRDKGESIDVKEGNTAVFSDKLLERPIEKAESILLENMTLLPIEIDVSRKEKVEELNKQIIEQNNEVDKKLKAEGIPNTVEEIKEQYGRIDEVILYSGKIIRGVIVERSAYVKVLTPSGYVSIPAKKVRNTRIVR